MDSIRSGKTDSEVRRFAIETDQILVTLDGDFANLIRFSPAGTPESFGCDPIRRPEQTFVQFSQNGCIGYTIDYGNHSRSGNIQKMQLILRQEQ